MRRHLMFANRRCHRSGGGAVATAVAVDSAVTAVPATDIVSDLSPVPGGPVPDGPVPDGPVPGGPVPVPVPCEDVPGAWSGVSLLGVMCSAGMMAMSRISENGTGISWRVVWREARHSVAASFATARSVWIHCRSCC